MYARSRTSGESHLVARSSVRCKSACVWSGRLRNDLTTAVSVWSWIYLYPQYPIQCNWARMKGNERTVYESSPNESTNIVSSSTALSIFSAYSPMIQMSAAFASGSSSSSRLAHSVGMTPSYVEGYLRKISCRPHHISVSLLDEKKRRMNRLS